LLPVLLGFAVEGFGERIRVICRATMCTMAITVKPVSGTVGAEVGGVDLSATLDEGTVAEIRRAFLDHHVLFFRDQDLSPEAQMRFGRCFGELDTHPFVEGMDAYPEVIEIVTEPDDWFNFGGGWHTDVTFLEEPDLGSILYAVDVPAFGGDTLFANQHAAYDALSETMKCLLDGLVAEHSAGLQYAKGGYSTQAKSIKTKSADKADRVVHHPLVRKHPETGKKALYVNRAFTVGIEGMRADESAALLEFLFDHAVREPFTCRFRWSVGSVAMWDNRSVEHYALYDYRGRHRHMRRITIKGDRPR
jgi:taurine dioxygenase